MSTYFTQLGLSSHAIPVGTSLPASPNDGDEAILVDSLTAPTYAWRFRYVAGITDTKKWVFIGGSSAYVLVGASESTTATGVAPINVATVGPSFVVPRLGDYEVDFVAAIYKSVADTDLRVWVGPGDYAVGAQLGNAVGSSYTTNAYTNPRGYARIPNVAAGTELRLKYSQFGAGTMFVSARVILVRPVRVA